MIASRPAGQYGGALRATTDTSGTRTRLPLPSNTRAVGCQVAGPRNGLWISIIDGRTSQASQPGRVNPRTFAGNLRVSRLDRCGRHTFGWLPNWVARRGS